MQKHAINVKNIVNTFIKPMDDMIQGTDFPSEFRSLYSGYRKFQTAALLACADKPKQTTFEKIYNVYCKTGFVVNTSVLSGIQAGCATSGHFLQNRGLKNMSNIYEEMLEQMSTIAQAIW